MFLIVDQLCSQFQCLLYCVRASKCSTVWCSMYIRTMDEKHRYRRQSLKYIFFHSFPISYSLSFLYLIWLLPSKSFTKLIIHPKTNAFCIYVMINLVIEHFAASLNLIFTGIYTQNMEDASNLRQISSPSSHLPLSRNRSMWTSYQHNNVLFAYQTHGNGTPSQFTNEEWR